MANIDEYLAEILAARYGEEVRGSIHDAIQEMNNEVTGYETMVQGYAETASQAKEDAEDARDRAEAAAEALEDAVPFDGATSSTDGTSGLVPVPYAGDEDKVLMGNGTWSRLAGLTNNLTTYTEVTPSTHAYSVGDYLIYDGDLYKVLTAIAVDDALVTSGSGQNIGQVKAMTELNAVDATATDAYQTAEQISDQFSTDNGYGVNDYCIYENTLYKFTDTKSAGAWDSTKVTATKVSDELKAVTKTFTINLTCKYNSSDSYTTITGGSITETGYRIAPNGIYVIPIATITPSSQTITDPEAYRIVVSPGTIYMWSIFGRNSSSYDAPCAQWAGSGGTLVLRSTNNPNSAWTPTTWNGSSHMVRIGAIVYAPD